MPAKDVADIVADEIAQWIERTAEAVAGAILDSPLAPQVVTPPLNEALDLFHPYFFNPDGTPNAAGRSYVMNGGVDPFTGQTGPGQGADGYESIAKGLARRMRQPALQRIPNRPASYTTLALDQMPAPGEVPLLATPGGA